MVWKGPPGRLPSPRRPACGKPAQAGRLGYGGPAERAAMRWIWIDRMVAFESGARPGARSRPCRWPRTSSPTISPATRSCPLGFVRGGAGPDGRHPRRRGQCVQGEGRPGQGAQGRLPPRPAGRRAVDLRGGDPAPAPRGGGGRRAGSSSATRWRRRPRSSSPTWTRNQPCSRPFGDHNFVFDGALKRLLDGLKPAAAGEQGASAP